VRLGTRLFLLGAVLPVAVMVVALTVAGLVFRAALLASLDQGLLAQAAVESVSLFDRAHHEPHLHMATSPLLEEVRPFAPVGELFAPDGTRAVSYPPAPASAPVRPVQPGRPGAPATLSTREQDGEWLRELVVTVQDPDGAPWVLRLTASLAPVEGSVRTFYAVALGFTALAAALLVALQGLMARRLGRRIRRLSEHLGLMRAGELERAPEPDAAGDEISELRQVLAETTLQLKAAREAQDRLLADAAHELRTPLTLMRTRLDLALRRQRTPEELRSALADTRAEVDRLAALATSLLDMASAGRAWDRSTGDLSQLAEESCEAARAEAETRGLLLRVTGERPASARFHAPSLRQAVDNLLSNALKFAPRGSEITVSLRRTQAGALQLSVEDAGPGIPEDQREAIFAPFHRGRALVPGAGLGLTVAREVMRQHGGRAFAEARSGPGACVTLELPGEPS
jgi:signal transduction histidine kinase